jgi:heat shock protein HslJ
MQLAATMMLCLTAVVLCGGCGGKSDQAGESGKQAPLLDTNWNVVSVDGAKVTPAADNSAGPNLVFKSDKSVAGFAGVNNFFGTYELPSEGALRIRPGGVTRKAGPQPLMQQEQRLLGLLQVIDGYRIKGDELTLRGQGRDVMKLRAAAPATGSNPANANPTSPPAP